MRNGKKITTFIIILIIITSISQGLNGKVVKADSNNTLRQTVKAGVMLNNTYNPYNILIRKSLEDIQNENKDKIEFTFFDGKGSPAVENEIINNMIQSGYDLIITSLVDKRQPELIDEFIYNAKQKNIPLIFFNITPVKLEEINEYPKSVIINTDSVQAAILQGKSVVDFWNANKEKLDKNGDGILEYIMLKGESGSFAAIARSKYSIETINDAGISTKELGATSANWNPELAQTSIESFFLKYGDKIEAIIANNDSMAVGAVKALQKYGYNTLDKEKNIPVFGIGGIPEAIELIKKGYMTCSVPQDTRKLADAIYAVGMNLVSGQEPLEGTNYKFNETGVIILIPFEECKCENIAAKN